MVIRYMFSAKEGMEEQQRQTREWVARYRKGQIDALGELVEMYRCPLYAYILRMTEGQDDADEIFQEVWFRAIRSFPKYKNDKLISWLFRIAHNLVIDRARKKKPGKSLDAPREDGSAESDHHPSLGPTPDAQTAASDMGRRIQEEVGQLPPDQKEVFIMRTEAQLSFKEIARIQKVSLNTALGRMHYAVGRLREALAGDYAELNEVAR